MGFKFSGYGLKDLVGRLIESLNTYQGCPDTTFCLEPKLQHLKQWGWLIRHLQVNDSSDLHSGILEAEEGPDLDVRFRAERSGFYCHLLSNRWSTPVSAYPEELKEQHGHQGMLGVEVRVVPAPL